jgi:hypothetical protein
MGSRIGIIAGSGEFPLLALEEAKRLGFSCVVAGLRSEAVPDLKSRAEVFEWIGSAELEKMVSFFKSQGIREVIMVGKIDPRTVYKREHFDEALKQLVAQVKDKTPTSLLKSLIDYLGGQGIAVSDPTFLLAPFFCSEGVMTKAAPSPEVMEDIDFAWSKAKALADLDIGQTLIVKNKAILAAEGMEGTDEAIKRSGRLAGEGIVVVKVSRAHQDMRIDVPAVGLETMWNLVRVRAAALCIEALKVSFFQKEEALALADANGIAVVSRKP